MKKLILIFLLIPFLSFSQDKVKFLASGVTCSLCSNAIHKSLHSDKEVLKIEPNLKTQEWIVEYKEGSYNFERLKKSVEDAGFGLYKVWVNDKIVYEKKKKNKNGN